MPVEALFCRGPSIPEQHKNIRDIRQTTSTTKPTTNGFHSHFNGIAVRITRAWQPSSAWSRPIKQTDNKETSVRGNVILQAHRRTSTQYEIHESFGRDQTKQLSNTFDVSNYKIVYAVEQKVPSVFHHLITDCVKTAVWLGVWLKPVLVEWIHDHKHDWISLLCCSSPDSEQPVMQYRCNYWHIKQFLFGVWKNSFI